MNNKKGFTLVEILSVIVLISLLLGLGIPGVMKISERMKEKSYNTKIDLIEQAGKLWGQDNKTLLQSDICIFDEDGKSGDEEYSCYKIKILDLIVEDYLEADSIDDVGNYIYDNPETNKSITECNVFVYKKNSRVYAFFDKSCDKTT